MNNITHPLSKTFKFYNVKPPLLTISVTPAQIITFILPQPEEFGAPFHNPCFVKNLAWAGNAVRLLLEC